ncbi:hypothetical protein BGZ96_004411 [Linnemannia gamsii]|uniref:PX domain-containing protein n=1 Tax=Linnemannia gamsii TaxID=64522 RepID=A0ABQ7K5Q0_9FUNG|nr:hypothetical protein BGZ96_004411 [Linnemannia gamsii]
MTTTTTTKAANGRHRGRTHSNTTSVIDPSALQYASKFSNSNNNIIVTSAMAGLSSVTGPANSTIMFPPSGIHLYSNHHNNVNAYASSNSSTTTTFYSGVKLAPPVLSASIEQLERRASDQKIWYTIQVCPCDLTIITPASASTSSSSNGTAKGGTSTGCSGGTGGAVTSIPRKPYKIYRRYEDVADFADQLEDEFAGRMVAPSATISLQHDTKDFSNAASTTISTSTSGGIGSSSYCVNGNVIGSGSLTFTEKGMDGGASATSTNINQSNTSLPSSTTIVALPRLKSRLVLFVTKAVCLQRKEELDRYLQELFTLGPIIAQSRLVAEFFGIWKTDMEIHLSQEDRDPLALHSVVAMTTLSDNEKDGNIDYEHESEAENGEDVARGEALQEASTSAGEPVTETSTMDSLPSLLTASPSPPIPSDHASALDAHWTYRVSSSSTSDSTSISTDIQSLSTSATMNSMTSAYLASPSLSPSLSACAYDSQDVGWTPSLSTLLPLDSETGVDVDAEMASPTELGASVPLPLDHTHLELANGYESGAGTETETLSDITTRTIKKFKSLRRAHTSSHSRQQQQQDSPVQEDSNPVPTGRSGSVSGSSGSASAVPLTTTAQPKSKIMKRSKTIVFRPEVTMQPLSSKNVIPPWNRIPSFANNSNSNSSNSGAAPISPISPTTPQSVTTMSMSSGGSTPNTITSDQIQPPSPTSLDMEEELYQQQQQQPRKLTMSHSKTMSSISTTPSWSFGNNNVDHPTLAPGSLTGLSLSSISSNSTTNSNSNGGSRNGSITSTRSMSVSAGITPTTLVAPWNRANGNGETNTHLHSLIKMSGQPSPSLQSPLNSPFVPVELGRSFHKKESQSQKSPSNKGNRDRAVPVLTQPPEARNRNPELTSLSFVGGSTMKGRTRKPGMTHSVSAPGGFLPIMTVSAPDSTQSSDSASETMAEDVSGAPVKAAVTRKRVSLHSPSLPTKQPIGILKNAQRGVRKGSLTVPGAVMFPVQSSPTGISAIAAVSSTLTSSSPSTPATVGGGSHSPGTLATTFKIVIDADTIVALQVLEDSSFVLTMSELRTRVKAKLTKSNIQLPDKFDLLWTVPTNSLTLSSPLPSTPTSGMSSMSINQAATAVDQGVMLKTDEDLHRAIHASRNHKVTLRCIL